MSGALRVLGGVTGALTGLRQLGSAGQQLGQGLAALAGAGAPYGLVGAGLGPWANGLQPASWRGVPFAVRRTELRRGRRVAVHEYPYRDDVWVEDLGRGTRAYRFTGFLLGDDVYGQRATMLQAAEQPGAATLVHPSLGALTCVLTAFSSGEATEAGRLVELEFEFVESAITAIYPTTGADTQDAATNAAAQSDAAAALDFVADTATALQQGAATVTAGVATLQSYVSVATGFIADGARVAGAVEGIGVLVGGWFGRYDGTAPPPYAASLPPIDLSQPLATRTATAVAALTANAGASGQAVAAAGAALIAAAGTGAMATNPNGFYADASALTEAVRNAANSPADEIRQLSALAATTTTPIVSTAPIGQAMATVQTAVGAVCRRAALGSLARACAAYVPSSYDDAVTVRGQVSALLDDEIVVAADAGDIASYGALRALRTAVIDDLTTRGAQLPRLVTVTRNAPLPALLLAWQLYQDSGRADDLTDRADPIHPAFMPTSFQALAGATGQAQWAPPTLAPPPPPGVPAPPQAGFVIGQSQIGALV